MNKFLVPALAAVSLAAFPAIASPDYATQTEYVNYGDLDLTQITGRETLMSRVDTAVDKVCGDAPIRSIQLSQDRLRCHTEAADMAFEQVARLVANVRVIAQIRDEYFRSRQLRQG